MDRCEKCQKSPRHPDKKCCFSCARSDSNCEVWHNCGDDCPGWEPKKLTNADRIRSMTDEELVDILYDQADLEAQIKFCQNLPECEAWLETPEGIPEHKCKDCLLKWLQQPVKEDDHE